MEEKEEMMKLSQTVGVAEYINFIGFRDDVGNLINISDLGVSSSFQEGLSISVAEILYLGTPMVISNIRGHNDIVENGQNGFLFDLNDKNDFIDKIIFMYDNPKKRKEMGGYATKSMEKFVIDNTLLEMVEIYSEVEKS